MRLVNRSRDRKSTRLNSSHGSISYAVFCLKKNNNKLKSRQHIHCRLLFADKNRASHDSSSIGVLVRRQRTTSVIVFVFFFFFFFFKNPPPPESPPSSPTRRSSA